jgi:hypothetical protein
VSDGYFTPRFFTASFRKLPDYRKSRNQRHEYRVGPMNEDMRRQLAEFFRPYNAGLYELIGEDFGWEQDG